LRIVDLVMRR